jgi:hypothetical protein
MFVQVGTRMSSGDGWLTIAGLGPSTLYFADPSRRGRSRRSPGPGDARAGAAPDAGAMFIGVVIFALLAIGCVVAYLTARARRRRHGD